jgi:hypothetical protein
MKSFFNSELFGDLTRLVQITFDQASEKQKQLFSQAYTDQLMDWDTPQYGLTFEEIVGTFKLTVLASVIGDNAATPLRSHDGLGTFQGSIPRIGHKFPMQAGKLRELLQMLETKRISDSAKIAKLQETMFANVADAVKGVKDRLDFITLTALSNDGVVTFDESNNPDGRRWQLNYQLPEANKKFVNAIWNDANLTTADPFADLIEIVNEFKGKVEFGAMLMDNSTALRLARFKTIKQAIYGTDKLNTPLALDYMNQQLSRFGLPPIMVVSKRNDVLVDGKRTAVNPWNTDKVVFIPTGKIGIVKTAFEDSQIMPEENVSYSTYDRGNIVVAQWRTGESKNELAAEMTQASSRALPVFTTIDGIVSLDVTATS